MFAVTGAAGRLGNVLVRSLLERFPETPIRALVLPGENTVALQGLDVEIVEADVTKLETLVQAFKGVDGVFHLAGFISLMPDEEHLLEAVNVRGAENVITACRTNGVKRLVHTASAHALSEPDDTRIMDENRELCPQNALGFYGRSKAKGAQKVLEAAREDLDAVIVCPTGIIGPYDYLPSSQGRFIVDSATKMVQAYTMGAYDFVDARDVADGMIKAYEKGTRGEYYILGGERINLFDMILLSKTFANLKWKFLIKIPVALANFVAGFMPRFYRVTGLRPVFTRDSIEVITANSYVSHSKATRELGYNPRPILAALKDTVDWFKDNGHLQN